jgi:hypothetical protein
MLYVALEDPENLLFGVTGYCWHRYCHLHWDFHGTSFLDCFRSVYIQKAQVLSDDTTNYVFLPRWWRTSRNTTLHVQYHCELFFAHLSVWAICSGEQFAQVSNLLRWAIYSGEQFAQVSKLLRNLRAWNKFLRLKELVENNKTPVSFSVTTVPLPSVLEYNLVLRRTTR